MPELVPRQSWTPELLDQPEVDPQLIQTNLRDMARANRWLGADRAVLQRVATWVASLPPGYTPRILDVATGGGGLPRLLASWSLRHGRPLQLMASDLRADVLSVARRELAGSSVALLRHDALALPFHDDAVDIVTCTQALHHFDPDDAVRLLRELARVARLGVVINDLRRSYGAYWGALALARVTRSPLSRHDGPLSVLRAYTPREVERLVRRAAVPASVRSHRGFRLHVELHNQHASRERGALPPRGS